MMAENRHENNSTSAAGRSPQSPEELEVTEERFATVEVPTDHGNSVNWELDARYKTRTVDDGPNGRAFVNIENSTRLMLANNVLNTVQTQTVVRLHNVRDSVITDNIITFGSGGNAVAQTGECTGNTYRRPNPQASDPFDVYAE